MIQGPLHVTLGKTGDILTILPIMLRKFQQSGKPVPLMVSKDYASVLEGCSYVHPVIFDGGVNEIGRAVTEAEKMADSVVVSQVCGPEHDIKRYVMDRNEEIRSGKYDPAPVKKAGKFVGDSFQKSLWQLYGHWGDFPKGWPLVFDRRDKAREEALLEQYAYVQKKGGGMALTKSKIILVSTGRNPGVQEHDGHFKYKSLLMLVLELAFKNGYKIVDLDRVKAERVYDLLALYESATVLVATDNAPLHLAYAVGKLPVLAFVADRPAMWNGSGWRPNHIFHCRYSDFPDRATEMVEAIRSVSNIESRFFQRRKDGAKRIHVWSQYEVTPDSWEKHVKASENWQGRYHRDGNWISCKIERGALGRDTTEVKMEGGRYPFLKDVLRCAAQRANNDDTIVVTRADTHFGDTDIREGYAHRLLQEDGYQLWSPWVDLIAFSKSKLERLGELPDLVMGPDLFWSDVLKEWAGVPEIENAVWKPSDLVWIK